MSTENYIPLPEEIEHLSDYEDLKKLVPKLLERKEVKASSTEKEEIETLKHKIAKLERHIAMMDARINVLQFSTSKNKTILKRLKLNEDAPK